MRVLVAHATKHGATGEIAERIGAGLRAAGIDADVREVSEVRSPGSYDAFVVGSALYLGRWLRPATTFVRGTQDVLAARPTWLFSSGPLGDPATDGRPDTGPRELVELTDAAQPREHRVFAGVLDPDRLTLAERALRRLPSGREILPEGDFRDWESVDAWSADIARSLRG